MTARSVMRRTFAAAATVAVMLQSSLAYAADANEVEAAYNLVKAVVFLRMDDARNIARMPASEEKQTLIQLDNGALNAFNNYQQNPEQTDALVAEAATLDQSENKQLILARTNAVDPAGVRKDIGTLNGVSYSFRPQADISNAYAKFETLENK